MTKKLLGIDLGGTTIKFGILTLEGEVQENGQLILISLKMVNTLSLILLDQSNTV